MGIPAQLTSRCRATHRSRRRAGIALPAALLALALVAALVAAVFHMGTTERQAVAGRESATRAMMLAEEGVAHAATLIRENLAGRTSTQLLRGPDNAANTVDDGLLTWTQLASGVRIPLTGFITDNGSYTIRILDDPAETDGVPLADRNERLLVVCSAVLDDGSSADISVVVRSAPTPGIAVQGNAKLSGGNMRIKGQCGSVHINGNVDLSGTAYIGGQLAGQGTVSVGGALKDTLGNTLAPKNGVEALEIPDLDPMANCSSAEFQLRSNGTIYRKSTNTTYNATSTEWFGWKRSSSSPLIWTLSGDDAVDGSVCVEGNVVISGNPGTPSDPLQISLYTSGSLEISGNPYLTPAAGDSVSIMAGGDVKIGGNPDAATRNFEGMIYAESQCLISGNPRLRGQLVCKNKANASGTNDIVSLGSGIGLEIGGDPEITYDCNGKVAGRRRILVWTQPIT